MSADYQQFVLKWHYHETTLVQNLPYLLENDLLSDVTLSVGAQQVKAHKIILAMCSVYFLQLFQEMKNTQHPVVVLHNASIEDVRAMLAFMYRGQCVVSKDQLPNLLSVAKLLKIQGLCDMKVPEKDVSSPVTESIPLPEAPLSPNDKNLEEEKNNNNISSSTITFRRHSSGSSTAINLSIDSKRVKLSSPSPNSLREKPSRKISSPRSTIVEDQTASSSSFTKKQEASETCKCFLCGKYLSNQYNLRVHMETHEEAFHACQSCPHVSRSRDALRKHVSYRHPDEYLTRKRKKIDNT